MIEKISHFAETKTNSNLNDSKFFRLVLSVNESSNKFQPGLTANIKVILNCIK